MLEPIAGIRDALSDLGQATPKQLAHTFKRTRAKTVQTRLDGMTALGLAMQSDASASHARTLIFAYRRDDLHIRPIVASKAKS
ncbi:hypothetical protein HAT86_01040 [Roseovarius gahaiensis]|uniref:Uncharacterized protein n=1 Tax=Roseovarius gahaiensis TaxID=2716691 RepID=A0A967B846_9RHOB|nr:hypothetical protein [Roseovarius gahaiensis]NHQ73050.1 hypothetical protein [Roseovarius gahaiensis]